MSEIGIFCQLHPPTHPNQASLHPASAFTGPRPTSTAARPGARAFCTGRCTGAPKGDVCWARYGDQLPTASGGRCLFLPAVPLANAERIASALRRENRCRGTEFVWGASRLRLLGLTFRPPTTSALPHQKHPAALCFGYGPRLRGKLLCDLPPAAGPGHLTPDFHSRLSSTLRFLPLFTRCAISILSRRFSA